MFSRSPGGPYRLFKLTGDMVEYSSRLALPFFNKDSATSVDPAAQVSSMRSQSDSNLSNPVN